MQVITSFLYVFHSNSPMNISITDIIYSSSSSNNFTKNDLNVKYFTERFIVLSILLAKIYQIPNIFLFYWLILWSNQINNWHWFVHCLELWRLIYYRYHQLKVKTLIIHIVLNKEDQTSDYTCSCYLIELFLL